jgi:ATP-dependent Lon protease
VSKLYEIMNPPFEDIINNISTNCNPVFNFSNIQIINQLKLIAIDELLKQYSDFTGQKLDKHLNNLKTTLSYLLKRIEKDKQIKDKVILNAFITEIHVTEDLINDALNKYLEDNNFNFKEYLNNLKKSITDNDKNIKKRKRADSETIDNEEESKHIITCNKNDDDDFIDDDLFEDDDFIDEDDDFIDDGDEFIDDNPKLKKLKTENKDFADELTKATGTNSTEKIIDFFSKLTKSEKELTLNQFKEINNENVLEEPLLFKFLSLDVSLKIKSYIIQKYLSLCSGGSAKLKAWIDEVVKIPFGKNVGIDIKNIKPNKIKDFLNKLKTTMDDAVYGHEEAKKHIIQIMAQQIKNPDTKGINLGLYGPPGNGKCFALDTPILMYDGSIKKVQNVNIGDVVMGDDSTPRNVLSLGSGEDTMYEIKSNKGDTYTVNSEHILCLKSVGLNRIRAVKNKFNVMYFNKNELKHISKMFDNIEVACEYYNNLIKNDDGILEITVKDYLKLPKYIQNKLKGYKVGVDFNKKDVNLDPYIIGKWLGDENSSDLNVEYENELKHYNLINNKHIPSDYLINDRETRLKLLAGLIDINGYYNKTIKNYEITQKSKQLTDDIIYLVRSLGFGTSQYKITKSHNNDDYYRIHIYGDNLFEIPTLYKVEYQENNHQKKLLINKITVISKGKGNYYGFTLDGNNRFLLGDFTVTHNTSLIKHGIAKAIERPFIFISLGGATDASTLEGHSYTYEGSLCGRIAQGIIDSKCMNPIIYFDELDKISTCHKGREITNLLVHLIDPIQNSHFVDKYFNGIEFDLSKVTFIFSYNDPSLVDRVLMDRITQVETKYLLESQKIHIANNYLLPEMLKEIGCNRNDIQFSNEIISKIINKYTMEGGVRKLKGILYYILREINICNLTHTKINGNKVKYPYKLNNKILMEILKNKTEIIPEKIHSESSCGIINGMYATDSGFGGVMPIQILWTPGKKPYEIKATGNLQLVIKESTSVAATLAFNLLTKEEQDTYIQDWKTKPRSLHIHCPDGSVPKDGPSAGTALTVAIYSLLTNQKIRNDIAITGEINLQGYVSAIGGLESKLQGAKIAGVKFALYPKENEKDIQEIKERNPLLIDDTFRVQSIEKINEAIMYSLV